MKRIITLTVAVLVAALTAAPVWADSIHVGDTTTINNNPTANASAAAAATAGASSTSVSNPVQVNTQVNTQSTHVSQGQEQGQGQLQGQGQEQSYQGQQNVSVKTDVPRQAPPAVPAALAVSSLTCYGSWSIAASTPFGGVGAGFPTKDSDCERSRNAALLNVLGYPGAALALMAQNEDTAKALKAAGVKVPTQVAETVAPAPVAAAAPAPIVAKSEPASPCGKDMEVSPSGFCRWKK
jgi:hypothetical protein